MECLHDRWLGDKSLCLLAELHLLLVVLLKVEISQLLINLNEVVEILNVQVICLPQILHLLLWHKTCLLPTLLQLAELGKCVVERLVGVYQLLKLLDD